MPWNRATPSHGPATVPKVWGAQQRRAAGVGPQTLGAPWRSVAI